MPTDTKSKSKPIIADLFRTTYGRKSKKAERRVLAGLSPEERESKKQAALEVIKAVKDPANMKYLQGMNLAAAVADLGKWDFVKMSARGLSLLLQGKLLELSAVRLRDEVVGDLAVLNLDLRSARTDDDLTNALARSEAIQLACLDAIEEMAKSLQSIGQAAMDLMEDKAVQAWVHDNPGKVAAFLDAFKAVTDGAVSLGTGALSAAGMGYASLGGAIEALKMAVDQAISKLNELRKIKEFKDENLKGEAFNKLDENPALMAKVVADDCIYCFDQALAIAGIGMVNVPGWSQLFSPVISVAGHSFFLAKVELLEDNLKKAKGGAEETNAEKVTRVAGETVVSVKDGLLEALLNAVGQVGLAGLNLGAAAVTIVKKLAEKAVTKLVKHLPIDPAQGVTGDDLRNEIIALANAETWTTYHRRGTAQQAPNYPKVTKDGDPVQMVTRAVIEKDDNGEFVWAKVLVGGASSTQGRLYMSDASFLAELPPFESELAKLPETDKFGNPVLMARGSKTDGKWEVRIGVLWGFLDQRTKDFLPDRPDPSAYADWTQRTVSLDGYTEEGNPPVKGKWYKPWIDGYSYLFVATGGDKKEWAHATSLTGNVKGVAQYNIEGLFSGKVTATYDLTKA